MLSAQKKPHFESASLSKSPPKLLRHVNISVGIDLWHSAHVYARSNTYTQSNGLWTSEYLQFRRIITPPPPPKLAYRHTNAFSNTKTCQTVKRDM